MSVCFKLPTIPLLHDMMCVYTFFKCIFAFYIHTHTHTRVCVVFAWFYFCFCCFSVWVFIDVCYDFKVTSVGVTQKCALRLLYACGAVHCVVKVRRVRFVDLYIHVCVKCIRPITLASYLLCKDVFVMYCASCNIHWVIECKLILELSMMRSVCVLKCVCVCVLFESTPKVGKNHVSVCAHKVSLCVCLKIIVKPIWN